MKLVFVSGLAFALAACGGSSNPTFDNTTINIEDTVGNSAVTNNAATPTPVTTPAPEPVTNLTQDPHKDHGKGKELGKGHNKGEAQP